MDLCNINHIKPLLSRHGFHFSKSMGQNFLTASWVPDRICAEAGIDEQTGVLEVGPGIGCLTVRLAASAGKVVAVELDRALEPVLEETLADCENAAVIFGDILKMDIEGMVKQHMTGLNPVVCANLPYNITSPVISALIESGCFDSMTLMVQREVARRICAKAGTADYGAFTVYCGWYADSRILFDVPPECFVPQPKVWSSVIKMTVRKSPPVMVKNEKLFFDVVRAAFAQRRKTLANALSSGIPGCSKEAAGKILSDCGFSDKVRGEELDVCGFASVADRISEIL
ncbi:MAG: ribosomal RNA small subunit methyltransferase A [Clostridiales bacterium]|nr:ribosomal RNA small subunit methyltransferase A [Clostridiales bacterium]